MSHARPFPELPDKPTNQTVASLAQSFFGRLKPGLSPAVARFYKSQPALMAQPAGPWSTGRMGYLESQHVEAHADPHDAADQAAKRFGTIKRTLLAASAGTGLATSWQYLAQSHPDADPTGFGGS